jgi:hypothetical protein
MKKENTSITKVLEQLDLKDATVNVTVNVTGAKAKQAGPRDMEKRVWPSQGWCIYVDRAGDEWDSDNKDVKCWKEKLEAIIKRGEKEDATDMVMMCRARNAWKEDGGWNYPPEKVASDMAVDMIILGDDLD